MKKLLILLFSILISLNSYGEEINSLFGITLNENAEKYASSNYINSNKLKNTETLSGYYDLSMTDKIKTKSPYASEYYFTIDTNNIVHSITGFEEYANLKNCQAVLETLTLSLEKRHEIDFLYFEPSFPTGKKYAHYHYTTSGNYFEIQCNENFEDSSIVMQTYLDSYLLVEAFNEFYNSGL